MSPTLLEFAVAIVLLVVAWQIGVIVAPGVLRWLRGLKDDMDDAAATAFDNRDSLRDTHKEEHSNGTHR